MEASALVTDAYQLKLHHITVVAIIIIIMCVVSPLLRIGLLVASSHVPISIIDPDT